MPDIFGKKKVKELEDKIYTLEHQIKYLSYELDRVYKDIYGRSKQTHGLSGSSDITIFTPVWKKDA